MTAAVMTEIGHIEMKKVSKPQLKPHECLIKMKHVGICGSDVHYYEHGKIGDFIVRKPIILGHEAAGEIIEIGSGVDQKEFDLHVGDQVCMEPGFTCGHCCFCKTGKYNLCEKIEFMATPPFDGALVEYVAYPASWTFKLPSNMKTDDGALMEPLSVGIHATAQAEARMGQTAIVLGAGPIGAVTILSLKARGVTQIIVTDLVDERLKKAKELGASHLINAKNQNVEKEVSKITRGHGCDLVFETAGSIYTTKQTVDLVKRGGTILLVGMPPDGHCNFNMVSRYNHFFSVVTNQCDYRGD